MGCNKMKRMGREKSIGNTQKFGKRIKIKFLGMAAVLLALPVYGISNELFKLAVCRDNSVSLFQKKGVRKLAERLNEMIAGRGRKKWGDGKEPADGKRTADDGSAISIKREIFHFLISCSVPLVSGRLRCALF